MNHDEFLADSEKPELFFPGELRAAEDALSRIDIDAWLETGRTNHFAVADIVRR